MRKFALFGALALSASSFAQVTSIGQFTGALQEGFETQTPFQFLSSYSVFGGGGTVQSDNGSGSLHITTGWSYNGGISPHGGTKFLGGITAYEYVFNTPVLRFGGFFGTNSSAPGAVATFFDANNQQIGGPVSMAVPQNTWHWEGWQYAGGIKRVLIVGNSGQHHVMSDDLELDVVPEPATMTVLGLGVAAMARRRRKS